MAKLDRQREFLQAIETGDIQHFRRLLDTGIDVNFQDDIGWTPLFYAVAAGDLQMISQLLRQGADPRTMDNSGWTPLGHARLDENREICDLLEV